MTIKFGQKSTHFNMTCGYEKKLKEKIFLDVLSTYPANMTEKEQTEIKL